MQQSFIEQQPIQPQYLPQQPLVQVQGYSGVTVPVIVQVPVGGSNNGQPLQAIPLQANTVPMVVQMPIESVNQAQPMFVQQQQGQFVLQQQPQFVTQQQPQFVPQQQPQFIQVREAALATDNEDGSLLSSHQEQKTPLPNFDILKSVDFPDVPANAPRGAPGGAHDHDDDDREPRRGGKKGPDDDLEARFNALKRN